MKLNIITYLRNINLNCNHTVYCLYIIYEIKKID